MNLKYKIQRGAVWAALWASLGTSGLATPLAQTLPFTNSFETYVAGTSLSALTNDGWDASSPLVVVQTNVVWAGTNAVLLPVNTTLSNAIAAASVTNVWTDSYLVLQPRINTNGLSVPDHAIVAVNLGETGYLQAYDRQNGWLTLSNTVWGGSVTALTNGQWARVTVFQNYVEHHCAVFLDGNLLTERLPFVSNVNTCASLRLQGDNSASSYFDDFAMRRTIPATLTNNWDEGGSTDAEEIDTYGYLALTLNVGPLEAYTTIQAAVDAALPRYTINVAAGSYTESVTITQNLANLTGVGVTVNGAVSLASGIVVSASGLNASSLTLASNAQLNLTNTTVTVGTLVINTGARVVLVNSTLTANGVTLHGTFTLDENWGNAAGVTTLPYTESFETYQPGTPMNALGFRGWGASDSTVTVTSNQAFGGTNAVVLGYGLAVSNRVDSEAASQVWTDFRGILRYDANDDTATVRSNAAFMMVVTTNGYLGLYNRVSGNWEPCTNDVWQNPVAALTNGHWARISVNNNYATKECAVFLNGVLVRQQLPFINTNLTGYSTVTLANKETNATYMDDLYIGAVYPSSLTNDLNGNALPDAYEIQMEFDLFNSGTVYLIR